VTALSAQFETLARTEPLGIVGRVAALRGMVVLVRDLPVPVGSVVRIEGGGCGGGGDGGGASSRVEGEVIGFDGEHSIVMALSASAGVRPGDRVSTMNAAAVVGVGAGMLGRVVDGVGRPIDGLAPLGETSPGMLDPEPLAAMKRRRITEPLTTGVRAIDLMTPLGRGQRMGVFAGPGVGKSTLLGWIAKRASSDVNVVALIGERGREVKDFIAHSLGPEGLKRTIVVVATGDESPLMRVRAARVACAAAEHFRDRGKNVLLMMDSVTRLAHAQRQIGLSVGEPPATRGYTPSVFSLMARILERAGAVEGAGSITGLYTVLVEGDEMTEPVADAARGILDGHIILSRKLAQRGHFPAIDVLDSVSRVGDDVSDPAHVSSRRQVLRLLAGYRDVEDLVQIGAYAKGSSVESDVAIAYQPAIVEMLKQSPGEPGTPGEARQRMVKLAIEAGAKLSGGAAPRVTGKP
jgi:flagellum-specific ATP synthase